MTELVLHGANGRRSEEVRLGPVTSSRRVLAKHARSFRWAAAFLPRRCHDDAALLYAFCRAVDDAADESANREQAERELATLEHTFEHGTADGSIAAIVRRRILHDEVGAGAARDLLFGARSDLQEVRIENDEELLRYCYRVAGTVGVMMCRVLGVNDPAALPHAIDLGIAMQLTNICRDVLEDARNNRVYLPADRLRRAGTSQQALLEGTSRADAVSDVVRDLLLMAERFYQSSDAGLRFIPRRPRLAILVASRLYRAIGLRLLRRGADPLRGRTVVGWLGKLGWIANALATWATMRWRSRFARPHQPALHVPLEGVTHAATR
jgi:phytoene synthase